MIKSLTLKNLILVESCEITFQEGFTALTGETGAGKTALTEAIELALGARADSSLIRKGHDKALIELSFEIDKMPVVQTLLHDAGLECDPSEFLIIRREISKEGKNRAFINCQMVPLPTLQKIGASLLELIGQHSHQIFCHSDFQRSVIDAFGNLHPELLSYKQAFNFQKSLEKKLTDLISKETYREREEDTLRTQIAEIESIKLKEEEEEEISEEHKRLSNCQEITEKTNALIKDVGAALPLLNRSTKVCDSLKSLDTTFQEPSSLLQEAHIALSETAHLLQSYLSKLDNNPSRLSFLDDRLGTIHRLKRKYGSSFSEIVAFLKESKEKLAILGTLSEEIDTLKSAVKEAEQKTLALGTTLSKKRKAAAAQLSSSLTSLIHTLNMTGAKLEIRLQPQAPSLEGCDLIEFWISANPGEPCVPVKEHASGGELSRLLFAIKTLLAEKNDTPTLIFDEIDSNVGGQTASIIGKQLKNLGLSRQVICITHFPQVASQADCHISVQKQEINGRTVSTIRSLTKKEKELELLRMLGGKERVYQSQEIKS